jgi:hypothetical protein
MLGCLVPSLHTRLGSPGSNNLVSLSVYDDLEVQKHTYFQCEYEDSTKNCFVGISGRLFGTKLHILRNARLRWNAKIAHSKFQLMISSLRKPGQCMEYNENPTGRVAAKAKINSRYWQKIFLFSKSSRHAVRHTHALNQRVKWPFSQRVKWPQSQWWILRYGLYCVAKPLNRNKLLIFCVKKRKHVESCPENYYFVLYVIGSEHLLTA